MNDCIHSEIETILIATQCVECKKIFHHRVRTQNHQYRDMLNQVHRGLIDADTVINNTEWLTDEQKQALKLIEPCKHPTERLEEYFCPASQSKRWRCLNCGQVWDYDIKAVKHGT